MTISTTSRRDADVPEAMATTRAKPLCDGMARQSRHQPAEHDSRTQPKRTILVIDDDPRFRKMQRGVMTALGYAVVTAADGESALPLLDERDDIGLVICDMVMPGMSGLDVIRAIRTFDQDLPIIIVTGKPAVDSAVECMKIGANDYINKPFDVDRIKQAVTAMMTPDPLTNTEERSLRRDQHGRVLGGYRVGELLGEGYFGVVFKVYGREGDTDKTFALKILRLSIMRDEFGGEYFERFIREGRAVAAIDHPNVVPMVDFGLTDDDAIPFIVMAYIDGCTLAQIIQTGNPTFSQKLNMLTQIARGVGAIHRQQIFHRDLKPENILVTRDYHIYVADLGVARIPGSKLTRPDQLLGTPYYMAPESLQFEACDCRSDFFSLGVVGYELLTGKKPFSAANVTVLCHDISHRASPKPSAVNPDIPSSVEAILLRLLEKSPDDRYQSADDIITALESCQR